jgi:hypothetical protein
MRQNRSQKPKPWLSALELPREVGLAHVELCLMDDFILLELICLEVAFECSVPICRSRGEQKRWVEQHRCCHGRAGHGTL